METYKLIKIKDIQTNPYQPRVNFDTVKLNELASSIKSNGIIQPLIVRPSQLVGYELMAGERRLRASQIAGLTEVPAIIKDLDDNAMQYQAIIENLQRDDLNPIEEAKSYQKLIDKGNTHEDIATTLGKSRPYISNIIRLLKLCPTVKNSLEKGEISQGHARLLLKFSDSKVQELWNQKIIHEKLSVHQLEKQIKLRSTNFKQKQDIFINEITQQLNKTLGTKVEIKKTNSESGYIKINFKNLSEFERIINNLK